jgi:hypothetical protein
MPRDPNERAFISALFGPPEDLMKVWTLFGKGGVLRTMKPRLWGMEAAQAAQAVSGGGGGLGWAVNKRGRGVKQVSEEFEEEESPVVEFDHWAV